jgi:hypothetical protein
MNTPIPARPAHVPTLTEVIETPLPEDFAPSTGQGELSDLPRNLMRGLGAAQADHSGTMPSGWGQLQPASMPAPPLGGMASDQDLQAARANLSDALRSARDGRWAPMSNVEVSAGGTGMLPQAGAPADAAAQLVLPELGALLETPPHPAQRADLPVPEAAAPAPALQPAAVPVEVTDVSEAQLAHRVLAVVQKQIDGMLDYRLREAMTPILQRHTDALVRDLRDELKQTMQDVITRAVAQEMAKVRQR